MESMSVPQTSLYNGISNRSRGWKTRKSQNVPQPRLVNPTVMRWDGASRSKEAWDGLRRDPELWFLDGDCDIHLHGEGQSRRGPAFRVPYSALVEANCQLLIDNFESRTQSKSNGVNKDDDVDAASSLEGSTGDRIELFIPAPAELDKRRSYDYHLATRNFFAFIFRRPVVGECLGSTLITLMHSLHQFRTSGADNVRDLMSYVDEQGYSYLNGQPTYALAMLRLAETFQLRDLYIDAFAHSCGMGDQLCLISEYQLLCSATRLSLRRARLEMHSRLGKASNMLKTFLKDEMFEMDIMVCPGARAHLQRFRAFLQEVYAAYFGYYPPPSIDAQTTIFEADVFRAMRHDFKALYEFLVDENYEGSQTSTKPTGSGIDVLRDIKLFDKRYSYETLLRPFPLLPDIPRERSSYWIISWRNRPSKASQPRGSNALTALSVATNSRCPDVVENHLVYAYRKFEEGQIPSVKEGNMEPVDGRKLRWILIYAIYQTLRHSTGIATEISDATGAAYHLGISTAGLPPWERSQLDLVSPPPSRLSSLKSKIKSNNDSPALEDQATWSARKRHGLAKLGTPTIKANFTDTVTRKSSTLRRSLSFLIKHEAARPDSEVKSIPYHEIIVRDFGNGTSTVADKELAVETTSANLTNPLSSMPIDSSTLGISKSSSPHNNSETDISDTPDTSIASSTQAHSIGQWEDERSSVYTRRGLHDTKRGLASSSSRRPRSLFVGDFWHRPIKRTIQIDGETRSVLSKRRPVIVQEDPRKAPEPVPVSIPKPKPECTSNVSIQMPSPQAPTAWDYIQAVMEVQASHYEFPVDPEWDQFAHLGNVIEARSETLPPATTSTCRRASTIF
ncbi:hypothetical protein F4825DRAFT_457596 [Nemania diffusa]|nr:hypothetical protein F4825DRAFT_457596 [Nemania diffusa]